MENINIEFSESATDALFEVEQSAFDMHANDATEPDEEDEEDDNEDKNEEVGTDRSNENDPPLDDNVVHSPLPPQTGGKPGPQVA